MPTISRTAVPGLNAAAQPAASDALVLLFSDGRLESADLESGERVELGSIALPSLDQGPEPLDFGPAQVALHVSHNGRFVAAVTDRGLAGGSVIDLQTGHTTLMVKDLALDNPEVVRFSFCFLNHGGRDLVAHRTAWNRLDISDAETGELLTPRETPDYSKGPQVGGFDYFHGGLTPSPDSKWILDNGWVWHPIGAPYLIDGYRWLGDDVWESETAESKRPVTSCDDWDLGDCWIDNHRLALRSIDEWPFRDSAQGIFPEKGLDGVRIVDANDLTVKQFRFEGPRGEFLSHGSRLFSVADGATTIWSLDSGSRLDKIGAFEPSIFSRRLGLLIQVGDNELIVAKP